MMTEVGHVSERLYDPILIQPQNDQFKTVAESHNNLSRSTISRPYGSMPDIRVRTTDVGDTAAAIQKPTAVLVPH